MIRKEHDEMEVKPKRGYDIRIQKMQKRGVLSKVADRTEPSRLDSEIYAAELQL